MQLKGEIFIITQKKKNLMNERAVFAEKILAKDADKKYYDAIRELLEKGYLLDDISAIFLKELWENKRVQKIPANKPKMQNKNKMQNKQANKTDKKRPVKQNRPNNKKRPYRPKKGAKKNENSNS